MSFASGGWELMLLALLAILLMAAGAWLFRKSRVTPAERERRRRLGIHRTGRMGDATIIDVREWVLFYSYQIRGVAYTTSQDASDFKDQLPADTSVLIGLAGLKYSPGNPANSIVICEEWTGLRPAPLQFQETQEKRRP
jgi:hypothetical protein